MQVDQKGMSEKAKWATQFSVSGPKPGPPPFPAKSANVGAHNSSLSRENTITPVCSERDAATRTAAETSVFPRLGLSFIL
ncbi:hypothetical protein EV2_021333 [Malus domestica]